MKLLLLFFISGFCALPQFQFPEIAMPSFPIPSISIAPELDEFSLNMVEPKNVKTEEKTTNKDGTKIKTIRKTAPGFLSEMVSIVGGSKNNKMNALPSALTGSAPTANFLLGDASQLMMKRRNCTRKCGGKQFCDNDFGVCRQKLEEGDICTCKKQCSDGLTCIWGNCNKGKDGSVGTFCEKKSDCRGELCCVKQFGMVRSVCSAANLEEGSVCGKNFFLNLFDSSEKAKTVDTCANPCKDGLKCSGVGASDYKICVSEDFKEPSTLKTEQSSGDESSGDEKKDNGENDSTEEGKIPVQDEEGKEIPGSEDKKKQHGKAKGENKHTKHKKVSDKNKKDKHIKFQ